MIGRVYAARRMSLSQSLKPPVLRWRRHTERHCRALGFDLQEIEWAVLDARGERYVKGVLYMLSGVTAAGTAYVVFYEHPARRTRRNTVRVVGLW